MTHNKFTNLKIIFAGTPEFAVPSLAALLKSQQEGLKSKHQVVAVYTQPDAPVGRGRILSPSPVKLYALAHNIPVFQPTSLRQIEAQQQLASLNADIMIVIAYGQILPEAVLQSFPLGCINVHASLLPRWRGAAPIQRSIQAGDQETGITIMKMARGLDTGPMLYQVTCPIAATDTGGSVHDRLSQLGSEALLVVMNDLKNFLTQAEPQVDALATYAHKLSKQEGRIDWQQSAIVLERQIRAFTPWPGNFCYLDEEMIRIHKVSLEENQPLNDTSSSSTFSPGTIININKQGIDIATAEGVLRLQMLQFAGGKPLRVNDILNAKPRLFRVGMKLS